MNRQILQSLSVTISVERLTQVILISFVLFLPDIAFAFKLDGYAPPFYSRFISSLYTLSPGAILIGTICYYRMSKLYDTEHCQSKKLLFILTVFFIIVFGSLTAASDAYNDESSNPAFRGTAILSLIVTIGLVMLNRQSSFKDIRYAIYAYLPFFIITLLITSLWQYVGNKIGIPTTW